MTHVPSCPTHALFYLFTYLGTITPYLNFTAHDIANTADACAQGADALFYVADD